MNHGVISQMPSNDDTKQQNEEMAKGRAYGGAVVASVLPDDHTKGAEYTSMNEASVNEVGTGPLSSDHSMPQEFTFFQKKKHADQEDLNSFVAYASSPQVTAFAARFDRAVAVNAKTQRHIAELMILMSDVARTMTTDVSKPTRKRLRRSKWLFFGCLVSCGVGWFLLFPSGHNLITQLATLLAR